MYLQVVAKLLFDGVADTLALIGREMLIRGARAGCRERIRYDRPFLLSSPIASRHVQERLWRNANAHAA
ncbi:hypothetical protein LB577_05035 [Mesorhizobium sp. B283B1A]|uniref:hypothetical protein n=1 Tax=Mesorhizobium TaxID=68287 RepID=UPI001CD06E6F|nr:MULTISPECIES: hypothetical protein [Mesorhizobium]MCA0046319.1 hypothetical protein [Mesorhizobium sp. B283B1A]UQS62766.1 hypothetical protein M5D98_21750 [Mesorhizobium opportunistum]